MNCYKAIDEYGNQTLFKAKNYFEARLWVLKNLSRYRFYDVNALSSSLYDEIKKYKL